ncbi:unnamed protein product [Oncorhynchus mykiss]|uniref:Uncharacterized protein n=1 Tax=Oncorhynchus mykiss TaxID=8022 RepID=A0A060WST6_ONCMY|nr:unnamed protein product [Oncorhynchus mykiss]
MDFNLLTDSEARSPALSLSDSGTPQHDQGCKGQDNSGQFPRIPCIYIKGVFDRCPQTEITDEGYMFMHVGRPIKQLYNNRPNNNNSLI